MKGKTVQKLESMNLASSSLLIIISPLFVFHQKDSTKDERNKFFQKI